jgi:ribosomal protein L29
MATLEDLEARVAALEAAQADYRAVLAAVNALGANQRDHAAAISELRTDVAEVKTEVRGFRRSSEENLAELKDLIVGLRDT